MSEPVVEARGLSRYFGAKAAVYEVSLSLAEGEVLALLGPNGAGKSTLIGMLLGLTAPTRGRAAIFGCDAAALTPEVRARIGYLTEGHRLYDWMRIRELARLTAGTHPRYNGPWFRAFIDYFGLDEQSRVRELSNGQRAQVSLALTLACEPDLLVMDDPTLGIDAAGRRDFLRGVVDLVARAGCSVIMSSHILSDVERVADRVAILVGGRLRVDATLDELRRSIRRYHLTFPGEAPADIDVPRCVSATVIGGDVQLTVVRPGPDVERALDAMGAASCEEVPLSLEDAFVDYTAGRRRDLRVGLPMLSRRALRDAPAD